MATEHSSAVSPASTLVPVTRPRLERLLSAVAERVPPPVRLYLVGDSALVAAGLQEWTDRVVYAVDTGDPVDVDHAMRAVAALEGIAVERESPADVLPLPSGYEERAREVDWTGLPGPASAARLEVRCFDPVSVAVRLVARGDEPDYRTVLAYLRHGWVTMGDLDSALAEVLPRFSVERIQQDPAEFRRKFKGLQQMWRALPASAAGRDR
jgi:hypothetical protein